MAAAGKAALEPLGFRRKSQSRVWLADRGFWLSIVEFQPSGWSKGSYLNVAAHWLWDFHVPLGYNYILDDVRAWVAFKDTEQFQPLAEQLAARAAEASHVLERRFATVVEAAEVLIARAEEYASEGKRAGWPEYDAGVAAGLVGRPDVAQRMLSAVAQSFANWQPDWVAGIEELASLAHDTPKFRLTIQQTIDRQRALLKLAPKPSLSIAD